MIYGFNIYLINEMNAEDETQRFINLMWHGQALTTNQIAMQGITWTSTCRSLYKHMQTTKTRCNGSKRVWPMFFIKFIMFITHSTIPRTNVSEIKNNHINGFLSHHSSTIHVWFILNQHVFKESKPYIFTHETLIHHI